MAEVVAGVIPLTAQRETPFEEDEAFAWSVEAQQGSVAGLYNVTVRVVRQSQSGLVLEECSLSQMVLDPAQRGSTKDAVIIATSDAADPAATDSSQQSQTGQGTTTPSGSGSTGGTSGGTMGGTSGGTTSGGARRPARLAFPVLGAEFPAVRREHGSGTTSPTRAFVAVGPAADRVALAAGPAAGRVDRGVLGEVTDHATFGVHAAGNVDRHRASLVLLAALYVAVLDLQFPHVRDRPIVDAHSTLARSLLSRDFQ